VEGLLDQKV